MSEEPESLPDTARLPVRGEVLLTGEVARRFGVDPGTVRRWVKEERFPRRPNGDPGVVGNVGRGLLFHLDAVERALDGEFVKEWPSEFQQ